MFHYRDGNMGEATYGLNAAGHAGRDAVDAELTSGLRGDGGHDRRLGGDDRGLAGLLGWLAGDNAVGVGLREKGGRRVGVGDCRDRRNRHSGSLQAMSIERSARD